MTNEDLAVLIQQGQQEYIPTLYDQVKKLLMSIAKRYFNKFYDPCASCGVTLDDLMQESYLVMLEAIRYFKPDSGNKFISYLSYPMWNHFQKLTGCRTCKRDPINYADSLDAPLSSSDDVDYTLGDTIKDENSESGFEAVDKSIYLSSLHDTLEEGIGQLPQSQQTVIRCRYYQKKNTGTDGK